MYIYAKELKMGDLVVGGEVVDISYVGNVGLNVTIEDDLNGESHQVKMVENELIFVKD